MDNIIFIGQDSLVYEYDGLKSVCLSVVCDSSTWDTPHVFPKKKPKKRKKGLNRNGLICTKNSKQAD